ncbi:ankyrin repeat-containing protein [Tanacetum coccineum]|uniref:Ankyrin repeat-containing protein n=1 Tax=Tanacetum coccineum TaxID=301880 RepID=A0ABQ4WP38_9ASTR
MVTVRGGSCDGDRRLTEALAAGLPGSVLENGGDTPLAGGVVPRLRLVAGKSPEKQRRLSLRVVARGDSCGVKRVASALQFSICERLSLLFYRKMINSRRDAKVLIKIPAKDVGKGFPVGKLRDATREGNWWRAQSILRRYKFEITAKINNVGETMLHLAVEEGNNYFVQKLLNSIQNEELIEVKNNTGQTALHIAALVGNKYAAELLVKKRDNLLYVKDNLGKVPLLIAYSTNHISTFAYLFEATKTAGELLCRNQDSFEKFIIRLIYRKEYGESVNRSLVYPKRVFYIYDNNLNYENHKLSRSLAVLAYKLYKLHLKSTGKPTDKVLMELTRNFPSDIGTGEKLIYPSWENACQNIVKRSSLLFYSFDYLFLRAKHTLWRMESPNSCNLSTISVDSSLHFAASFTLLYVAFPPVEVKPIKDIEQRKKVYKEANSILDETICHMDFCNLELIVFEAVRLDVYEVLRLLIRHLNQSIEYTSERHNIIQLAIIHRSEKVYNHIFYPLIKQRESYRVMRDYSGNNLLHLVGRLANSNVLSSTTGAALQLQRELHWREEVKKFMEPMQLTDLNIDDETPEMVFTREHEKLMKDGETWMKKTAESCSITAALIVTIVFAAAITVPGGSNQETGIPLFKKQIAFTIFAISDAISLFSASTSLLVFLSILTTRFAENDFLLSLPRRLLIALCLLFLSTSAMMLAFSAILFLVFCDQRPWMLAPIGVFTCMPITAIVSLQLPLVVDLYRSTYSFRLGKQKLHYPQL